MGARLAGLALFLPVPIVLVLLTRLPLGTLPSLGAGLVLVATHGLYARPWALSRAGVRCLYCGGPSAQGPEIPVREPFGATTWRCCRESHARPMRGVLSFSAAHRLALRVGILGGTLALLGGLAWAGLWGASTGDLVAAFRVVIACSVLPLSILGPSLPRGEGVPVVPFPLHIQALIGTLPVLWLFRVVGLVWLVMGLQHLGGRVLGGVP